MKKISLIAIAALFAFCSCRQASEPTVMARFVPERYDDFIFENNLICGRIYGEALENDGDFLTSPGIDIWVKLPGALVADQRYKDELENGRTYHKDWGNGKDCYKVSKSLGGGASAAIINDALQYPATNYRSYEIIEQTPDKVVFTLDYPEWKVRDSSIALSKTFTVTADSYFVKVEDVYTCSFDSLEVAAGVFRHPALETIESEMTGTDRYAIWEKASDQKAEPEDGMLGVAVYVPGATFCRVSTDGVHGLAGKCVKSGEPFVYYFGNCWSKGDVKTAEEWFEIVNSL